MIALGLPMSESAWAANVMVTPAGVDADTGAAAAHLTVDLDADADAAADGAAWFVAMAWQGAGDGGPGGFRQTEMHRGPDGLWRTEKPIPVSGYFKSLLRLHSGTGMQAVAIALPADPALEADRAAEVPAVSGPKRFQREKAILQREAITDNVGARAPGVRGSRRAGDRMDGRPELGAAPARPDSASNGRPAPSGTPAPTEERDRLLEITRQVRPRRRRVSG